MQKSKVRGGGAVGSEFAPPSLHPLGWAGSGRASSGASSSSQEEWEHFAWFQERLFAFELEDWEGSDFEGPLGPSPPLCGGPTPPAQEGVIVPELWTKTGKKEERQAEDFGGEKDNDTSILSQASTVCRVIESLQFLRVESSSSPGWGRQKCPRA